MNAKEVNETFDLVSHVSGLVTLHKSGAYFIGPCPMCGGVDRFQIKRNGCDVWICRKCNGDTYHSVIDFFMSFYNVPFAEALKMAGGDLEPPTRPVRTEPPRKVIELPNNTWQAEAWREVETANDCLLGINGDYSAVEYAALLSRHIDSVIGRNAREYLTGRGITRAAWVMFDIGFTTAYGREAITLPYADAQNITAIKYRYIDGQEKNRFAMKAGSRPLIFGLQNCNPSSKQLVIVEGELNCVSLWQVLPKDITVISVGSDTNTTPLLRPLASRFDDILIWMDDPTKAQALRLSIGREAKTIKTPVLNNTKFDANEMLKQGVLSEFISKELEHAQKAGAKIQA